MIAFPRRNKTTSSNNPHSGDIFMATATNQNLSFQDASRSLAPPVDVGFSLAADHTQEIWMKNSWNPHPSHPTSNFWVFTLLPRRFPTNCLLGTARDSESRYQKFPPKKTRGKAFQVIPVTQWLTMLQALDCVELQRFGKCLEID